MADTALLQTVMNPKGCFYDFKRFLGRPADTVKAELQQQGSAWPLFPLSTVELEHADKSKAFHTGVTLQWGGPGDEISSEELYASFLKLLSTFATDPVRPLASLHHLVFPPRSDKCRLSA
jgi:molecular chaperone DnaK (HSP70)